MNKAVSIEDAHNLEYLIEIGARDIYATTPQVDNHANARWHARTADVLLQEIIEQRLVPNTELGHLEMHGMAAEDYCSSRARKNEGLSWKKWAERFQEYLDRIERLFSPDLIVIGGGVSRPERVMKYFDYLSTNAELVPATLENEAGIIGAACAARRAQALGATSL